MNKLNGRQEGRRKSAYIMIGGRGREEGGECSVRAILCTFDHVVDSTGSWRYGLLNKRLRIVMKPSGSLLFDSQIMTSTPLAEARHSELLQSARTVAQRLSGGGQRLSAKKTAMKGNCHAPVPTAWRCGVVVSGRTCKVHSFCPARHISQGPK